MEPGQLLRVNVTLSDSFWRSASFYAEMRKDGRITVPKLVLSLLRERRGDKITSLAGCVLDVTLEPA
jgi:bifunctional DNA-binding transcriptional regulator/antitoxin component of YhaV-PrlF toxin-antitoxin module